MSDICNRVKNITKGKFNRVCKQSHSEQHYSFTSVLHNGFVYVCDHLSHQYVRFKPLEFFKQCRKGLWLDLSWEMRYEILMTILIELDSMTEHDMDIVGWVMVQMKYERLYDV